MSKLLINENPLVLLPSLAVKLGLNQAIVIQQIHYWLQTSKTKINDKKWVYNTIDEWHEQFPFFSRSTLERTISSLIKDGFLIVEKLSNHKSDRTNYYTIDYVKLNEPLRQNDVTITSNCCDGHVKMTESTITSNCCDGYTENTETSTETSTEKNTKTNTREENFQKSEQDFIDKVTTDNRKTFPITFDWKPNDSQFAAYCQRKLITPNQLTKEIFDKFVDKTTAKGEVKTEAQWCELLASYLKTCLDNPIPKKPNPHIYQPERPNQEASQSEHDPAYKPFKPLTEAEKTKTPLEALEKMRQKLRGAV